MWRRLFLKILCKGTKMNALDMKGYAISATASYI